MSIDWTTVAAELAGMSDTELRMTLVEWKRWRARVQTAPTMRLRRQRAEEAAAYIEAIEQELALREPGERFRRRRQVASIMQEVVSDAIVSLAAFRSARQDLARLERRRPGCPRSRATPKPL
jgi:hypothetical protein